MKTFILSAVMALVPGFAFASNCHNAVVVQRVQQHHVQPIVTFVQPVRQVQFVEVRDNHHQNNVQRIVIQQQNHHNHHAQAVVVQEVKVQKVVVQRVQNHHQQNQRRGFFQRITGR